MPNWQDQNIETKSEEGLHIERVSPGMLSMMVCKHCGHDLVVVGMVLSHPHTPQLTTICVSCDRKDRN